MSEAQSWRWGAGGGRRGSGALPLPAVRREGVIHSGAVFRVLGGREELSSRPYARDQACTALESQCTGSPYEGSQGSGMVLTVGKYYLVINGKCTAVHATCRVFCVQLVQDAPQSTVESSPAARDIHFPHTFNISPCTGPSERRGCHGAAWNASQPDPGPTPRGRKPLRSFAVGNRYRGPHCRPPVLPGEACR